MVNDNASQVVIDMTGEDKKTYGRLYFRPLTPRYYIGSQKLSEKAASLCRKLFGELFAVLMRRKKHCFTC